jgi:hypothetical protein
MPVIGIEAKVAKFVSSAEAAESHDTPILIDDISKLEMKPIKLEQRSSTEPQSPFMQSPRARFNKAKSMVHPNLLNSELSSPALSLKNGSSSSRKPDDTMSVKSFTSMRSSNSQNSVYSS